MTVPEPRSEKSIFLDAIEIESAADRRAFLDQACEGQPQLRASVEALLQAEKVPGGWLDAPSIDAAISGSAASDPSDGSEVLEQAGTILGRYTLIEEIGEGGMGTVFLAEQTEPVQRRVAVKIIKPGMDSRQVIARFRAEQQALALMDHPNIARVLDAGSTPSGRPYFVMELVHGTPITTYCDEHRLSTKERLDLFLGVCQAVQHSHQKGIIHRDIKPSNVLVAVYDGKPIPKVIDFGVARATGPRVDGRTMMTEFGSIIGTLAYMSPEQAESSPMDIDTRSDIYSLGVLLYELLTGTTPLNRTLQEVALLEALKSIREQEPPKPSTRLSGTIDLPRIAANRNTDPTRLSAVMRGDLDWIVMKSLEKDRNRRYETANGLAMDITRYLKNEAVDASPPSAWYRFEKFARRNRVVLVSATVVSTALVATVVVLIISVMLTMRSYEAERTERLRSVANFERARRAVDEQLSLVSQNKLFDVPGLQPVRKELLQTALRFYREMATDRPADSTALADLALACLRLSEVNFEVTNMDDALASLSAGLDFAEQLFQQYPDDRISQSKLAGYWKGTRRTVGSSLPPTDLNAAHTELQRFIRLWEKLIEKNPDVPGFRSDLANNYNKLGLLQVTRGLPDEGIEYTQKAIEIWRSLHHEDPSVALYRDAVVNGMMQLRHCLMTAGRRQEAKKLGEEIVPLCEALVADFPDVPHYRQDLAVSLATVALHMPIPERGSEAEASYRRSLTIARDLLANFPATPAAFSIVARSISGLMFIAQKRPDSRKAVAELLEEMIPVVEQIIADNRGRSEELARATAAAASLELAEFYATVGRFEDAEKACHESVTLYERLTRDSPTVREYPIHRDQALQVQSSLTRFRQRVPKIPKPSKP